MTKDIELTYKLQNEDYDVQATYDVGDDHFYVFTEGRCIRLPLAELTTMLADMQKAHEGKV